MSEISYPYSSDYQEHVLVAMLRNPTFLRQCRDTIRASFFENAFHQVVVGQALLFFDKYGDRPGNKEVFVQEVREYCDRVEYPSEDRKEIFDLLDKIYGIEMGPIDASAIQSKIVQFGRQQAIKEAVLASVTIIDKNAKDPDTDHLDDVVALVQQALLVGKTYNIGINIVDYLPNIGGMVKRDSISDPALRVPSGIPSFDSHLDGGLGAGELGFVVAESSKGKSMLLLNFAFGAWKRQKRVIYFTFELKAYEILTRFAARMSGLKINDDVKAKSEEFRAWESTQGSVAKAMKEKGLAHPPFQVVYLQPSEATPSAIRATLARIEAQEGWKPDLICVDYIDEMRVNSSASTDEGSYHIYGNISGELINISADYMCPVWTASQIQREAYVGSKDAPDGPSMSHLSRSIQKVEKAEVIVAIWQNDTEATSGQLRLRILKNRRGTGKDAFIRCRVDFSRALIEPYASAADPG